MISQTHSMLITAIIAGICFLLSGPAHAAQTAPFFACQIGTHTVSVTDNNGVLEYQYGTPQKLELSISGSATTGNVYQLWQRFAGVEQQLRFTKGDYSYIVYSLDANEQSGAGGSSGLVVMKGTKIILDKSCAAFTELEIPDDASNIPDDDTAHSAI